MDSEQDLANRIGAGLRGARQARRWSQATLAERLDVSVTYVGMLERGEKLASLPLLVQIARVLGVSVARLLGEPAAEPWLEDVVELLRALPSGSRDMVINMVRAAAASTPVEEAVEKRSRVRRRAR
jgi:transcriptional regulator with XRE-family HTH domain